MKKLNVGCGTDIKEGYINLDKLPLKGVDVVHDIEDLPLPFKDEEFDEILCKDILEHVDLIPVMKELHRILKTGGCLKIEVPHFTATDNFIDPTHKNLFSFRTFTFFIKDNKYRNYYFDFYFSEIKFCRIFFKKNNGKLFYNYILEFLVNLNYFTKSIYEDTFFRIFPAGKIIVNIIK